MNLSMQAWIDAIATGLGATATMDAWAVLQKRLLGIRSLDYAFVGRWLGHLVTKRQFHHDAIAKADPVAFEKGIGWAAHYATGIAFAVGLVAFWGTDWLERPTLIPPLIVGFGAIAFPFLILQPALGAGIASSRTANPNGARLKSLVTHGVFGIGLYVSALLLRALSD